MHAKTSCVACFSGFLKVTMSLPKPECSKGCKGKGREGSGKFRKPNSASTNSPPTPWSPWNGHEICRFVNMSQESQKSVHLLKNRNYFPLLVLNGLFHFKMLFPGDFLQVSRPLGLVESSQDVSESETRYFVPYPCCSHCIERHDVQQGHGQSPSTHIRHSGERLAQLFLFDAFLFLPTGTNP